MVLIRNNIRHNPSFLVFRKKVMGNVGKKSLKNVVLRYRLEIYDKFLTGITSPSGMYSVKKLIRIWTVKMHSKIKIDANCLGLS